MMREIIGCMSSQVLSLLLMHFDGSNGGTVFTDSSIYNRAVTASGNVNTSTTQKKFGTASAYFDGSGDFL